jgi:hypothetical protein
MYSEVRALFDARGAERIRIITVVDSASSSGVPLTLKTLEGLLTAFLSKQCKKKHTAPQNSGHVVCS